MNNEKLYFFSMKKNGHSIEYRRNYLKNTVGLGCLISSDSDSRKAHELQVLSGILMKNQYNGIVKLNGMEIAVAKEVVLWADNARHEKQSSVSVN